MFLLYIVQFERASVTLCNCISIVEVKGQCRHSPFYTPSTPEVFAIERSSATRRTKLTCLSYGQFLRRTSPFNGGREVGHAQTKLCHPREAGHAQTKLCHPREAGHAQTKLCHPREAGHAQTKLCHPLYK